MSQELIMMAIKRYESEGRHISHPDTSKCFINDNMVVLKNITGTLAKYNVDEFIEPEVEDAINKETTE